MQRQLRRGLAVLALGASASAAGAQGAAQQSAPAKPPTPPDKDYLVFVASEGNDQIALLRFGPKGASVERKFRISFNPTELAGPHGIGVAPDGQHYFVSTAHGTPNGSLWKYSTFGDSLLGRVELGPFPATLQVSPDGAYVYVVNFNFHGDMVPSSVSVVYGDQMVEVARVKTCTMPHGSRLSPDGTRHYSACMMDDMLVEIDASKMGVARHFVLTKGKEHGMAGAPGAHAMMAMGGAADAHAAHDMGAMATPAGAPAAKPAMPPSPARPRGRSPRPTARRSTSPATRRTRSSRWTSPRGRSRGASRRATASTTSPRRATASSSSRRTSAAPRRRCSTSRRARSSRASRRRAR